MSDENQENADGRWSRRRFLGSIATAGIAGAAGAGGTWAYLSDSDKTIVNFTTGDLSVNSDPSTLNFDNVNEGERTATVTITNEGSLPARQLLLDEISISGGDEEVAKAMEVLKIDYRGNDITQKVKDKVTEEYRNPNILFDLDDIHSYLLDNQIALEAMTDGDGIEPESAESADFSVTCKIDYSQRYMDEGNMKMSAGIVFLGKQQEAVESTPTQTPEPTDSPTPSPTPDSTPTETPN